MIVQIHYRLSISLIDSKTLRLDKWFSQVHVMLIELGLVAYLMSDAAYVRLYATSDLRHKNCLSLFADELQRYYDDNITSLHCSALLLFVIWFRGNFMQYVEFQYLKPLFGQTRRCLCFADSEFRTKSEIWRKLLFSKLTSETKFAVSKLSFASCGIVSENDNAVWHA